MIETRKNIVLSKLRNPYGQSEVELRETRIEAATLIEQLENAYINMREWAEKNGIDTTTRREK